MSVRQYADTIRDTLTRRGIDSTIDPQSDDNAVTLTGSYFAVTMAQHPEHGIVGSVAVCPIGQPAETFGNALFGIGMERIIELYRDQNKPPRQNA